jgi:enterochelin esterase family protein
MGGGQALTIGLNHTDRFGWVIGFSSSTPSQEAVTAALADPALTNRRLKLLWIGCGKADFLLKRNEEFVTLLRDRDVRHEWVLTEGDHSWPVWRRYLAEVLPRLF